MVKSLLALAERAREALQSINEMIIAFDSDDASSNNHHIALGLMLAKISLHTWFKYELAESEVTNV